MTKKERLEILEKIAYMNDEELYEVMLDKRFSINSINSLLRIT